MEQRADRAAHPMDQGDRRVVECNPGFKRRYRHLRSRLLILPVMERCRKVLEDTPYR